MKKVAIVSDIHSNREALTVVLEDIKHRNVDAIYCLGDVIGYGPDPMFCLDKAIDHFEFVLLGNHEEAVISGAFGFNPVAKQAVDWTRSQVKPGIFSSALKKQRWNILKNLPLLHTEDDRLFVHASPRDPTMDYVLKSDTEDAFGEMPVKIQEIFSQVEGACFVGHTHMPGIITDKGKWYSTQDFDSVWEVNPGERLICNVGSVGQPRDGDIRSCYITLTEKEIYFHRVPYDYVKTQNKIMDIAQLDNKNANRLASGK